VKIVQGCIQVHLDAWPTDSSDIENHLLHPFIHSLFFYRSKEFTVAAALTGLHKPLFIATFVPNTNCQLKLCAVPFVWYALELPEYKCFK